MRTRQNQLNGENLNSTVNATEVVDEYWANYFDSLIRMNKTIHLDSPRDANIAKLHKLYKYSTEIDKEMTDSFKSKYPRPNDTHHYETLLKNVCNR